MNPKFRSSKRVQLIVTFLMAAAILVPSLWGFGLKFMEFIALARGEVSGLFAVSPVVNYLLASLGFFCMLCWAVMHGMFRDVEAPKYRMLEIEQQIDRNEHPE